MSHPKVKVLLCSDEASLSQSILTHERETEDSDYEEVEDSDDSGSFHSEGEELAEYWDPYCKSRHEDMYKCTKLKSA